VLSLRKVTGSANCGRLKYPVVLMEVQVVSDQDFHHRLNLGTTQALKVFLQKQVEGMRV
jgi:hypothetical protein